MLRAQLSVAGLVAALAVAAAGCGGGGGGSSTVSADGSSTVGPYVTAAAETFQRENEGVNVTVSPRASTISSSGFVHASGIPA